MVVDLRVLQVQMRLSLVQVPHGRLELEKIQVQVVR
jgi:hypothetical protein